jgi:hypothetical protein
MNVIIDTPESVAETCEQFKGEWKAGVNIHVFSADGIRMGVIKRGGLLTVVGAGPKINLEGDEPEFTVRIQVKRFGACLMAYALFDDPRTLQTPRK